MTTGRNRTDLLMTMLIAAAILVWLLAVLAFAWRKVCEFDRAPTPPAQIRVDNVSRENLDWYHYHHDLH